MRNIFDPKLYKHVTTGKDYTVLKHKSGHQIRIAHNVLSKGHQEMLKALSKIPQENATASQAQEAEDQHQYGKVIMKADGGTIQKRYEISKETLSAKEHKQHANDLKRTLPHVHPDLAKTRQQKIAYHESEANKTYMADGGDIEPKTVMGQEVYGTGVHKQAAPQHEGTMPGQNDEEWPLPSQTSVGKAIQAKKDANGMAEGGRVKMAKGGISESPAAPGSTASGAYDAGLPCLNPNCKSHGRPHPNCRCYPNLAEGGTVNLRYCAHGKPHQPDCEYSKGGKVPSNDHLAHSTEGGTSEQGHDVRAANRLRSPGRGSDERSAQVYDRVAKDEARGRAAMERHIKPRMKFAEGTGSVPYGMRESDIPKDEHQTEQELDQYEAQNPSRLEQSNEERQQTRLPEFMQRPDAGPSLKPGMPGYDEPHQPISDTEEPPTGSEEQTNPEMYKKIHGEDNFGRMPAEVAPQPQAANPDEAPPTSDTVDMGPQAQSQSQVMAPQDHAASIMQETDAYHQDLINGHITPKTYNDLMFYNKDGHEKTTLGKIGSIFGLMLSSFGAGLAHQPIMALHMMDNAIKNDLNAQIKSKENAQNFYRLNQQMLLNDANIKNTLASANLTDEQKAAVKQGIDLHAATLTYNQLGVNAAEKTRNIAAGLPEGPEKQRATQLAMLVAEAAKENGAKAAAMAAGGINALGMYGMNTEQKNASPEVQAEQKFQNDMQTLELSGNKERADNLRSRHRPGIPGFATQPIPQNISDKFDKMDILDDKVKDLIDYAKEHEGTFNPKIRAIAAQKAHELTTYYNGSTDSLGMTPGRLGWLEKQISTKPTSIIEQILGSQAALGEIRDSNAHRKDIQLSKLGFPVNPGKPGTSSASPQDQSTVERKDPQSGRTVIYDAKTKKPLRWKD